jgi:hypothetical protein
MLTDVFFPIEVRVLTSHHQFLLSLTFSCQIVQMFFVNDIIFSESRFMLHVNDSEYPSANHEIHEILKYETSCINLANN